MHSFRLASELGARNQTCLTAIHNAYISIINTVVVGYGRTQQFMSTDFAQALSTVAADRWSRCR